MAAEPPAPSPESLDRRRMLVGAVVYRLGRAAGTRGYAAAGRAGADLARQHRVATPRPDSVRRGAGFTAAKDAGPRRVAPARKSAARARTTMNRQERR